MNENEQNSNYIDVAKLIQSSTYLNNLLDLTEDMADRPVDINTAIIEQFRTKKPDIHRALEQYNVLIHIIGAIKFLSDDIENSVGSLCDTLSEMDLL